MFKLIFQLIAIFAFLTIEFISLDFPSLKNVLAENTRESQDIMSNPISKKNIVFFGDSITAGYGLDKDEAFPALFQSKLDEAKLPYNVINAGLSGETTAGGLRRVDWILKNKVDIFILELGANDALRGLDLNDSVKNLIGIIEKVKTTYPDAKIFLAEMKALPNLGPDYTKQFDNVFTKVIKETNVKLIPFILDGVAGNPKLNLPDGIHPTEEGHKLIVETVWKHLSKELDT